MAENMNIARALSSAAKKDLSAPMVAAYDPKQVEQDWYTWWEQAGIFTPDVDRCLNLSPDEKFIMMIPPPNVTGSLHLGHALTSSIEDTLARWHRMRGKEVLWLPGVDHAGIATQSVVEKKLAKEENITRHDLGREAFVARVWEWKEQYGNRIQNQSRRMGISVDWTRFAFTMDEKRYRAVTEAFVRMWDDGIIYRANRLVNWSCALRTAISDLEVEHQEFKRSERIRAPGFEKTFEVGVLHQFAYPVVGTDEKLVVATTRLETMLGDTAVAVHPEDERYKHLIGKQLQHPFIPDRYMTVIGDPVLVDMSFGTGAVKVTPAHDHRDFECGVRNNLEMISVFTEDGRINENGGQYAGMLRFECRNKIEKDLQDLGLYVDKQNNEMSIGFCSRSGDLIEPMLKPQWYVKCSNMAERSIEAVRNKDLLIIPDTFEKTWFHWLENIKDWCISRQLWWGHRCPVYLVHVYDSDGNLRYSPDQSNNDHWVSGRNLEEATQKASKFKVEESDRLELVQDEDVLDTWFSSGLFPFSTLGWPDENDKDLQAFYPGTLLETGHDILFFWVARMVMMGLQLTNQLPFKYVYLHAMVRDSQGRKMSKSLGNVIDPLEVIEGTPLQTLLDKIDESNLSEKEKIKSKQLISKEFADGIPECGTDALRFGLLAYTVQARNINLDIKRVVAYRHFCNKLWNVMRFALSNFPEGFEPTENFLQTVPQLSLNQWILTKLSQAIGQTNKALETFIFGDAVQTLYSFWLYDLCDVYLEATKTIFKNFEQEQVSETLNTLYVCLEQGLLLLHPMIPFITEELYQRLPGNRKSETICFARYPSPYPHLEFPETIQQIETLMSVVKCIRSIQATLNLFGRHPQVYIRGPDDQIAYLSQLAWVIQKLGKSGEIQFIQEAPQVRSIMNPVNQFEVFVEVPDDVDIQGEINKLEKKRVQGQKLVETYQKKINAPNFGKAPEHVQEEARTKLAQYNEDLTKIVDEIEKFRQIL